MGVRKKVFGAFLFLFAIGSLGYCVPSDNEEYEDEGIDGYSQEYIAGLSEEEYQFLASFYKYEQDMRDEHGETVTSVVDEVMGEIDLKHDVMYYAIEDRNEKVTMAILINIYGFNGGEDEFLSKLEELNRELVLNNIEYTDLNVDKFEYKEYGRGSILLDESHKPFKDATKDEYKELALEYEYELD